MKKWERIALIAGPVALVAAILLAGFLWFNNVPAEAPIARSDYNTNVYTEQGGDKLVVASGGEIEVQSGGTLDVQSGATTDYSGGVDLDGASLVLDADGNSSITADTDDQIDVAIGGADDFQITANTFTALSGSSMVNNGTLDQVGNVSDSGGAFTVADNTLIDGAADAAQLTVQGYTTQTNSLQVWEQSDGTDVMTLSNAGNLDAEGTGNFAGLLTLQSGLTSSNGDNVVADDLRITAQTEISVTNGAAFTVTGTYQPIAAAGEVTPTLTAGTAGDIAVLINTEANTINIADTGTQMLTAAAALGQYDVLVLWSDGTNWIEISRADN